MDNSTAFPLPPLGSRQECRQVAAPGEKYAPGAFDRAIGGDIELTMWGHWVGRGRILSADVAEDGRSVTITYEVVK